MSTDGANSTAARLGRRIITVVPVTSSIARVYPFQVRPSAAATGLKQDSKAQAELVRSVAVQRVGELAGQLPVPIVLEINEALRLHLAL